MITEKYLKARRLASSNSTGSDDGWLRCPLGSYRWDGIRNQQLTESLKDYATEIQRIVQENHSDSPDIERDVIGREWFLDGLKDQNMANCIRLRAAKTLQDAYQEARQIRAEWVAGAPVGIVTIDGASRQAERELNGRYRQEGEPLQEYYDDLQFLLISAYPGQKGHARTRVGLESFLDGLRNDDLSFRVRRTGPSTMTEAYQTAVMVEGRRAAAHPATSAALGDTEDLSMTMKDSSESNRPEEHGVNSSKETRAEGEGSPTGQHTAPTQKEERSTQDHELDDLNTAIGRDTKGTTNTPAVIEEQLRQGEDHLRQVDSSEDLPPAYETVVEADERLNERLDDEAIDDEADAATDQRADPLLGRENSSQRTRPLRGNLFPQIVSSDDDSDLSDDWTGGRGRRWGFPRDGGTRLTSRLTRIGLLRMKMEYMEGVLTGLTEAEEEDYAKGLNLGSRILTLEGRIRALELTANRGQTSQQATGGSHEAIICWSCGSMGHTKATCPFSRSNTARQEGRGGRSSDGMTGVRRLSQHACHDATGPLLRGPTLCWQCGARSHIAKDCPQTTGHGRPSWAPNGPGQPARRWQYRAVQGLAGAAWHNDLIH